MSGKRSDIQFIHTSHPGGPKVTSAETQRRVHSHAARAAHAKAKRRRLVKYQGNKASVRLEDENQPFAKVAAEVNVAIISSPISLLGSDRRDPFASFARRLNAIEHFLLDYYMQNVIPCSKGIRVIQRSKIDDPKSYEPRMNRQFVQLAATNPTSLDGLFLVTSRHLSQCRSHEEPYLVRLALQYKIACARALMEAISSLEMRSSISDSTVTLAIFLAQDESLIGDIASTQRHLQGAIQMVKHNGSLRKTDFSVFLYDLIQKDIAEITSTQPVTSVC